MIDMKHEPPPFAIQFGSTIPPTKKNMQKTQQKGTNTTNLVCIIIHQPWPPQFCQVDEDGFTKVISGITRTPDGLTIRGAPRPKMKTGAFAEALTSGSTSGAMMGGKKKKKNKDG